MRKKTIIWIYSFLVMGCLIIVNDSCKKNDNSTTTTVYGTTVTDIDGNVYNTVAIGTQVWMLQNLKTTRYNDGTLIPLVTDPNLWINSTSAGYCWYNNDSLTYKDVYGALYNWYAVNTGKLAPTGWHVPTQAEWTTLANYLGGIDLAGGKLKEEGTTHWNDPNTGASNETGFLALPGGYRSSLNGTYVNNGNWGCWWTSTGSIDSFERVMLENTTAALDIQTSNGLLGFSIRCVKN